MGECSTTATQKENVLISAGDCRVSVLPEFGGKIASIQVRGRELLQAPLAAIEPRSRTMSFDAGDASGWDECLPSVAACTVRTADGPVQVPDHGDLWRVPWAPHEATIKEARINAGIGDQGSPSRRNGSVAGADGPASRTLTAECFSLPLVLERSLELREHAGGWRLDLHYTLRNMGRHSAPWSWAAHPLFAVEEGDQIELPASIRELRVEGSGRGRLGKAGDRIAWPLAKSIDGSLVDLSKVEGAESEIGDKLFTRALGRSEGSCVLHRPSAAIRIRVSFDPMATPYLGLWLCYGGWPARPGPKQMCVAMEPSTAPVDSLAVTGEWSRTLGPGESFSWPMQVDLEIL